jgi:hypothetical protein
VPHFRNTLSIITLCMAQVACIAAGQDTLRVDLSLSKNEIVLGEPVWVVLRITNISKEPQRVAPGLAMLRFATADNRGAECAEWSS